MSPFNTSSMEEQTDFARGVSYERRRMDALLDNQIVDLKRQVNELDHKVDTLNIRLAWLAGGLALVTFVANIIGPIIAVRLAGGT